MRAGGAYAPSALMLGEVAENEEDERHAYRINQNLPQLVSRSTRPLGNDLHRVNDIRRTSRNRAVAPLRPVLPSTGSEEHLVRK